MKFRVGSEVDVVQVSLCQDSDGDINILLDGEFAVMIFEGGEMASGIEAALSTHLEAMS